MTDEREEGIWPIALEAVEMIEEGMVVGLGTGRAASMFIRSLAARMPKGLRIRGVATSSKTAKLAESLSIPLVTLDDVDGVVDIDVDGADEVSPELDLIKGHGGALLRERIVAAASSRFVVLVGEDKLVQQLGSRVSLPVEVVPFGAPVARRALEGLGDRVSLRYDGEQPFRTDNGNVILDVAFDRIPLPAELERTIDAVPAVVDHGLFIGMADEALVQTGSGTKRLRRE